MPYEPAARRYRDPITEFLEALYINFDFDGAQTKLVECESGRRATAPALPPRCTRKRESPAWMCSAQE